MLCYIVTSSLYTYIVTKLHNNVTIIINFKSETLSHDKSSIKLILVKFVLRRYKLKTLKALPCADGIAIESIAILSFNKPIVSSKIKF